MVREVFIWKQARSQEVRERRRAMLARLLRLDWKLEIKGL